MTEFENDDAVIYKASCTCFHPLDEQTLTVTYIPNLDVVSATITANIVFNVDKSLEHNFFEVLKERVKAAWSILTTGRTTYETEFLFESERQLNDYIIGLLYALRKFKSRAKKDNPVVYD
ncbi:MAG: hypothetical protein QXN55_00405 [Candidatus Nitrosotenuis sp.]